MPVVIDLVDLMIPGNLMNLMGLMDLVNLMNLKDSQV